MKKDTQIKSAIDESLGSVRFNHQDMRAVLSATRAGRAARRKPARRKRPRYEWALAAAMMVLVIAPLSLLTAHALRSGTTDITSITAAGPGESASPGATFSPAQDVIVDSTAQPPLITESEAIQAARECFEAQCDTAVFTFEEYTVGASLSAGGMEYIIRMQSIYDNGCAFSVVVSAAGGAVLSHSAPEQATVPALLRSDSAEVQAWYEKHGAYSFMWPLDVQAEFSRRYTGAAQRMPQEDETDPDAILLAAEKDFAALDVLPSESSPAPAAAYITLHDGRRFADDRARYQVYCFAEAAEDGTLPDECVVLTYLAADGAFESSQIVAASGL